MYHATNYVFTRPVKCARRVVTIHDLTLVLFPEWHPRARVNSMTHEIARSLDIADHILADERQRGTTSSSTSASVPSASVLFPLRRTDASAVASGGHTVLAKWGLAQAG